MQGILRLPHLCARMSDTLHQKNRRKGSEAGRKKNVPAEIVNRTSPPGSDRRGCQKPFNHTNPALTFQTDFDNIIPAAFAIIPALTGQNAAFILHCTDNPPDDQGHAENTGPAGGSGYAFLFFSSRKFRPNQPICEQHIIPDA